MTNEDISLELLLEAIFLKYGYDFRDYARASIKRRIKRRMSLSGISDFIEMQRRILYDEPFFCELPVFPVDADTASRKFVSFLSGYPE